ncbi:MAG: hypothetical protein ACI9JR_000673 [Gammaproteobacteria bacterium]
MRITRLHFPNLLIFLCLLAFNVSPGIASEARLQPFQANYSLYISGLHVGNSKLTLSQSGNLWRWQTLSKPRGIYSLVTNKKPYSETTFLLKANRHHIQNILLSDEGDKNLYETAQFDWQRQQMKVLRKKITSSVTLDGDVYDYHSINWQMAKMMVAGQTDAVVDFYLKGEIVKSDIKKIEDKNLQIAGRLITAVVYELSTEDKESKLRYFYDPAKPLLPLKIEKIAPGKKTSILLLKNFAWH